MVMAEILCKWQVGLRLELAVAHVHHGFTPDLQQRAYRRKTQAFVREWAVARKLKFFTNARTSRVELRGEAKLRHYRLAELQRWQIRWKAEAIAYAHHQDDLLETRLIRLVRGSGSQGLRAMSVLKSGKLRPLLDVTAEEIRDYAKLRSIDWIEDPSNQTTDALRNWLRHVWLPSLEDKRTGARMALARSLELLVPATQEFAMAPYVGLRREALAKVPITLRRELLAQYLKGLDTKEYGRTHVDEILKRLNTRRREYAFEILGLKFTVTPEFLWASRV